MSQRKWVDGRMPGGVGKTRHRVNLEFVCQRLLVSISFPVDIRCQLQWSEILLAQAKSLYPLDGSSLIYERVFECQK